MNTNICLNGIYSSVKESLGVPFPEYDLNFVVFFVSFFIGYRLAFSFRNLHALNSWSIRHLLTGKCNVVCRL